MTSDFAYERIDFTDTFLRAFAAKDFSAAERSAFLKALPLLDTDERHPSLRVHQLQGDAQGPWSASANQSLRITFERSPEGRKQLITCRRHCDR